ncbi:MAG: N-acetyl sugar amidotransferase [Bdellovibrionota bacterium]
MLKRCVKCGLPETYETIEFDASGVCNICRQKNFKDASIDWKARKVMFDQLVEEYRGKYEYDCIVPFSGGKDSTFTLNYLMRKYKLKPLVVQFNHGFMRENLLKNNERTFKKLGVDVLSFTPNWKVVKRLMLEALIRKGDFCWHCHTGIFSYPMHVAIKYNTPLVIWGEPSSEYTAYYDYRDNEIEEVDETRFNRFVNLGITAEDMAGMIKDDFNLDPRDLAPYAYPKTRDLKRLKYRSVCLGSFIPWDVKRNVEEISRDLGWKGDEVEGMPPGKYPYEKIECYMQGVRDYIKYLKRGYSRVTQMTALDLRNDRISKEEADRLVEEYEGKKPPSLQLFLEYLGLSEQEFNEIVAKTVVPPFKPDFETIPSAPNTWDFERWYREGKEKP